MIENHVYHDDKIPKLPQNIEDWINDTMIKYHVESKTFAANWWAIIESCLSDMLIQLVQESEVIKNKELKKRRKRTLKKPDTVKKDLEMD